MTSEEKKWLANLHIDEAAGLDPEEYDPEYVEKDWGAVRNKENWPDDFIHLLVEGFDKQWTSEQFNKEAVDRGVLVGPDTPTVEDLYSARP